MVETFSDDVTKTVEALVKDVDACRAHKDWDKKKVAAEIKKIEQKIHEVRGGRIAHHTGGGVVILPRK